jgi:type I restriction enzyme R subunit
MQRNRRSDARKCRRQRRTRTQSRSPAIRSTVDWPKLVGMCKTKDAVDFSAGQGITVREYPTDIGPADYVLFVDRRAVGVIEAKPEDWGHKITTAEEQAEGYAGAALKWVKNKERLPFVYESTGVITRFTDGRDPRPRSREVFTFHRPETMAEWLSKPKSLRARLQGIPAPDGQHLERKNISTVCPLPGSH